MHVCYHLPCCGLVALCAAISAGLQIGHMIEPTENSGRMQGCPFLFVVYSIQVKFVKNGQQHDSCVFDITGPIRLEFHEQD